MARRQDLLKDMVDFFMSEGKVYVRSEYAKLGDKAPVSYKMLNRFFNGQGYNTILKMVQRSYPVEWASIGSKPVDEKPKKPVVSKVKVDKDEEVKTEKKPAKESLSPLDKLRGKKGESDE